MRDLGLVPGLYLIRQYAEAKGVYHFGILDVGNHYGYDMVREPVVFHMTYPKVRAEWLSDTGSWETIERITDLGGALTRLRSAARHPCYDPAFNNCEHFARYVATGRRESKQVQGIAMMFGAAVLIGAIVRGKAA